MRVGHIGDRHLYLALAEAIQCYRYIFVFCIETIMHFHFRACQRTGRVFAKNVVVIIVVLVRRHFKGIEVTGLEHRITKGVGLGGRIVERHGGFVTSHIGGFVLRYTKMTLVVVVNLLVGNLCLAAIDAVVDCVVADGVGQGVFVGHVGRRGVYQRKGLGEVERLAHLALLEERGVAFGRCLYHLVLHGIEFGDVFARLLVGANDDAVALIVHGVAVSRVEVGELLVARAHLVVQLVFHDPGGVVALELEHEAQAVAEVVDREGAAEGFAAFGHAAHHASHEFHLGLVPEAHLIDGTLEVVVLVALLVEQVTVVHKGMPVLHDLHGVYAARHVEFKLALVVGGNGLAVALQLATVDKEAGLAHGNARTFVEHRTAQHIVRGEVEVVVVLLVVRTVESDADAAVGRELLPRG